MPQCPFSQNLKALGFGGFCAGWRRTDLYTEHSCTMPSSAILSLPKFNCPIMSLCYTLSWFFHGTIRVFLGASSIAVVFDPWRDELGPWDRGRSTFMKADVSWCTPHTEPHNVTKSKTPQSRCEIQCCAVKVWNMWIWYQIRKYKTLSSYCILFYIREQGKIHYIQV